MRSSLGKYARTMEGRGEVLNMRNRVTIGDGDVIEAPVVPTGAPVPRGTMWSGEAQLLDEGWMMPNSSMCW